MFTYNIYTHNNIKHRFRNGKKNHTNIDGYSGAKIIILALSYDRNMEGIFYGFSGVKIIILADRKSIDKKKSVYLGSLLIN